MSGAVPGGNLDVMEPRFDTLRPALDQPDSTPTDGSPAPAPATPDAVTSVPGSSDQATTALSASDQATTALGAPEPATTALGAPEPTTSVPSAPAQAAPGSPEPTTSVPGSPDSAAPASDPATAANAGPDPAPAAAGFDPAPAAAGFDPVPAAPARTGRFRLHRSRTDRMLGGVCGGLAESLGVDAALLRVGLIALTLLGAGIGVVLYIAAWILFPEGESG